MQIIGHLFTETTNPIQEVEEEGAAEEEADTEDEVITEDVEHRLEDEEVRTDQFMLDFPIDSMKHSHNYMFNY